MIRLSVGAAAVVDDIQRVAQLRLAAQRFGLIAQGVDQLLHQIGDVRATAAGHSAKKSEHPIALRHPAVFGDYFRQRFFGQFVRVMLAKQPAHEAGEPGDQAQRVFEPRAQVADAQLNGRVALRGTDVPPDFTAVADEIHALVGGQELFVVGCGMQRVGQAGAGQRTHDAKPVRLVAGIAALGKRRRSGQRQQHR